LGAGFSSRKGFVMNDLRDILFRVENLYARRLVSTDVDLLQALLEHCDDSFQLFDGTPTWSSAAQTLLTQLPEGKSLEDKFVIGICGDSGGLLGVIDVIQNYPSLHEWFLGLMLLEPRQRNKGLGRQLYRAFENWVIQLGAQYIRLGVVEQNEKGYKFWQSMGYEIIDKKLSQVSGQKGSVTIVMRRALAL
jgi:GNAT superfamily N-acetyltransferase